RWGRHLSVFSALRATYEPYNFYRKILGFDTFTGFLDPSDKNGNSDRVYKGSMSVSENYEKHLNNVLSLHEAEAPLSHIKRSYLFKGDAPAELKKYLKDNPETIIALAYFDMDVYDPTKKCLELIKPYLVKGSVIAFDELMHPEFPGESQALKEVFNINQHKIERFPTSPYPVYITL
ncbi:crotonobetainyl-CoA--carnitine CoA-transferase, partial [Candidatus Roizmanbacteria bacterium CG09_land_8_20_14_0_10_41_9]